MHRPPKTKNSIDRKGSGRDGIFKLAYKLLVNDKPKFTALLVGITFAVFLMIQMTAMFAGILNRVRKSASIYPESPIHDLLRPGRAREPRGRVQYQAKSAGARLPGIDKDEFVDRITAFYIYQTGVGTNILIMTVMTFIVGLSISGQTFYTFVLENLETFGALKAMGAKSRELILMILFQASSTALTGHGLGIGLCAV
jgi:hypothetical protein